MVAAAAAVLAIPTGAQAWTAGTTNTGTLVVQNDVPGDGDSYNIGLSSYGCRFTDNTFSDEEKQRGLADVRKAFETCLF